MIVKCENCQTRFKIPDDKVTDKGVKVRCTKCSHTFRVKRGPDGNALIIPAAPSAAAPVQAAPENPFSQFAPPPPGGDMFSKETKVAPVPTRPPETTVRAPAPTAATLRAASAPEATVRAAMPPVPEVTVKGPTPTEVTRRAPAPTPAALAAAFATSDAGARTDPAMVRGPQISPPALQAPGADSSAVTDPAAAFSGGTNPRTAAPANDLFGDSVPSSGPGTGGFPAAGPPPSGPDRSLFDIPPPPPESAAPPDGLAALGAPRPELEVIAAQQRPSAPRQAPTRPSGRPEDARGIEERDAPGAARRFSGLLVNLAVAAGLVLMLVTGGTVYLNEGKIDLNAFSAERMKALFTGRRPAAVADISNGLYETRTGRSVFFVRGVVQNRGDAPMNAKVRAELLDGAELVRAAEGMAGASPTPEDVYGISSAADQARLTAQLIKGAKPVPPGEESPFFLLFNFGDLQSPDLANFRLRVTVSEGTVTADAAGAK